MTTPTDPRRLDDLASAVAERINQKKDESPLVKWVYLATIAGSIVAVLTFSGTIASFIAENRAKDVIRPISDAQIKIRADVDRNRDDINSFKKAQEKTNELLSKLIEMQH